MVGGSFATSIYRIPTPRTPLIGREDVVTAVGAALVRKSTSLLTLLGPGGIGKSRIAAEVARVVAGHFPDGVVYVPLASVHDRKDGLTAIGQALGIHETVTHPLRDRLVAELTGLQLLLVLENFEHVTESSANIAYLLLELPLLTVLVTSQVRLRLANERVQPVMPLQCPLADSSHQPADLAGVEAVQLFVHRARAVQPTFTLSVDNAEAVASVCRQLDGLPLAIELAAARINVLSPDVLCDRLSRSFLGTLVDKAPDRPARQQTMLTTIAWSYNLLTPPEQEFFRCVSVFAGGFTLAAAGYLWNSSPGISALAGTTSLVDKSTLRALEDERGERRFVVPEPIREFARAQAGVTDESNFRRHAAWCVEFAERASAELTRPDQVIWRERLIAEYDNLSAAFAWSLENDPELALRLVNALWFFWYAEGQMVEGRRSLERAIDAAPATSSPVRALALNNLGNLVYELGNVSRAQALYERSLELRREMGDRNGIASALNNLGMLATAQGELDRARELLETSLALRQELDPADIPATTLNNLGDVAIISGDSRAAQEWNEQALTCSRQQGNIRRIAHSLHNLGLALRCRGEDAAASSLFEESLRLFEQVGEQSGVSAALQSLGRAAIRQGLIDQARVPLATALGLHRQVLDRRGLIRCLEATALVAEATGKHEICVQLLGASSNRGELVPLQPPVDTEDVVAARNRARVALGDGSFDAAWLTGRAFSQDRAIDVAVALLGSHASADAVLSPREREVLRQVAQGASNQQIADTLFISLRTVKAHVTSILTKLDLQSRSAAVAFAHRNNLV